MEVVSVKLELPESCPHRLPLRLERVWKHGEVAAMRLLLDTLTSAFNHGGLEGVGDAVKALENIVRDDLGRLVQRNVRALANTFNKGS